MRMAKSGSSLQSLALSLLRIVAGFTFTLHGVQKFGALGGLGGHAAAAYTMLWFAGMIEIIGGPLIILGPVHPAGGVHSVRRNGGGVFYACTSTGRPGLFRCSTAARSRCSTASSFCIW